MYDNTTKSYLLTVSVSPSSAIAIPSSGVEFPAASIVYTLVAALVPSLLLYAITLYFTLGPFNGLFTTSAKVFFIAACLDIEETGVSVAIKG